MGWISFLKSQLQTCHSVFRDAFQILLKLPLVPTTAARVTRMGATSPYFIDASVFLASSAPAKRVSIASAAFSSSTASFVLPFFDKTIPW